MRLLPTFAVIAAVELCLALTARADTVRPRIVRPTGDSGAIKCSSLKLVTDGLELPATRYATFDVGSGCEIRFVSKADYFKAYLVRGVAARGSFSATLPALSEVEGEGPLEPGAETDGVRVLQVTKESGVIDCSSLKISSSDEPLPASAFTATKDGDGCSIKFSDVTTSQRAMTVSGTGSKGPFARRLPSLFQFQP